MMIVGYNCIGCFYRWFVIVCEDLNFVNDVNRGISGLNYNILDIFKICVIEYDWVV